MKKTDLPPITFNERQWRSKTTKEIEKCLNEIRTKNTHIIITLPSQFKENDPLEEKANV